MRLRSFWRWDVKNRVRRVLRPPGAAAAAQQGSPRVLFLSVDIGAGHYQAARAVRREWRALLPDSRTRLVNFMSDRDDFFDAVVKKAYMGMVNKFPALYRLLYSLSKGRTVSRGASRLLALPNISSLYFVMRSFRPDVVVATHPIPAAAAAFLRYMGAPPFLLAAVVTDFVAHSLWVVPGTDMYFVAAEETKAQLLAWGATVPVHVTGIPVNRDFAAPAGAVPAAAAEPVVLVMGGGLGLGPLTDIVAALDASDQPLRLWCLVGKNRALARRLRRYRRQARHAVEVIPFTRQVPSLMRRAAMVITKPGGLTVSEALNLGVPLVLFQPLPGQETDNAIFLTQRQAAIWPRDYAQLRQEAERLLTDAAARERLLQAELRLARPDAARRIAQTVRECLPQ